MQVPFYGDVEVALESADGAAHRVRVRVQAPAGLQAPDEVEVTVPATGRTVAEVRLWRSTAPRGSRLPLVVVAQALDDEPGRTASATVSAEILPDPAWLPRLRRPLEVLALLLMAAAAGLQVRQGLRRGQG